jgi:predicted transposase/invertase (TIGR01784 family)
VIDDFCKQLVARHPASISRWLLGLTGSVPATPAGEQPASAPGCATDWQLLDRELSSEPLHADSVVLLPASGNRSEAPILHLEFQTRPDPLMAERMLDYWIRLHRRFRRPVQQVVLHLKPTRSPLARIEHLAIGRTRHHFTSLRLWEQDPAPLLADPALLPLAVLARPPAAAPEQLLSQVRQRLQTLADPDQRRRTTSGCQLLAGLTFSQDVIQRLLAMSILEDSSVYQYIVRKGLEEGRALGRQLGHQLGLQEGLEQGLQEGLQQGRHQEASTLLLRQLERRCGPLPPSQRDRIDLLPLEQLEGLGDALLDFQGPADLEHWLSRIETT